VRRDDPRYAGVVRCSAPFHGRDVPLRVKRNSVTNVGMFRDRDLVLRALTTPLPARLAYRLSAGATALLGGARHRHASAVAGAAMERLLGAGAAAQASRFVAGLAADDLDACRAWALPAALRGAAVVEGGGVLPARGPALFVGFHLSGGLSVLEVLQARGLRPTFLRAPARDGGDRYQRAIDEMRSRYLERLLEVPWLLTGSGARQAIAEHLSAGGSVVALLDVPSAAVDLRDRAAGTLFGRRVELPVGVLRLALAARLPVIPFDGRVVEGRRIVRFHPRALGDDVGALLASVLDTLEGVVRERPWDWHSWLEIDYLLGAAPAPPS